MASTSSGNDILDDEMVEGIFNTLTDLRQYSKEVERELKTAEERSIQDCIKESENIADLHNNLTVCDKILERVETMLTDFQTDLNSISSEIVCLQKKSVAMKQELNNRQIIRAPLSQFVNDMVVSEDLIVAIMETAVNEKDFLSQLQILQHKIDFVKQLSYNDSNAPGDVRDVLERLKTKALMKIRQYLLEQIYKFRKPMTNYQVPQNNMLKYKFCYEFVMRNERNVAQEIANEYVDTMNKIYFSYFKLYSHRLMRLQYEDNVTKDDLMGIEDIATRGLFNIANKSLKHKGTVFTIGARGAVLAQQLEAPIIVPHVESKNQIFYSFETLFRSEQYALVDNACREYLFIQEFFVVKGPQSLNLFTHVMGKTINFIEKKLETYLGECYDSIAIFLCYHLVVRYRIMCHKRCVPALDTYWDGLEHILLIRFEHVIRQNIISVRECDPSKLALEMGPHYIARRYAEFSAALVGISESYPNELINRLLAELQEEVEIFILRMAAFFTNRREQLIFLINNYDMILHILMEHTRDNSREAETFKARLAHRSGEYAEEILSSHFGDLMQFAKEAEQQSTLTDSDNDKAKAIAIGFTTNWKQALEQLNREVILSFPNLVTGSTLLHLALTQLIRYYQRFHKLVTSDCRTQLTNIHVIMVEMKKYKINF